MQSQFTLVSYADGLQWLEENKGKAPALTEGLIRKVSGARQAGIAVKVFKSSGAINPDVEQQDHDISTRDGTTKIRVYRPKCKGNGALVILYHPGAFCVGDYTACDEDAQLLCTRLGVTCVSVAYRLAPEHPFPAAINDAWDALKWVASNATGDVIAADPTQGFVISGSSAGGTLAGVLAHLARDEALSPPLTGIHLACPGLMQYECVAGSKYESQIVSFEQNKDAPGLNLAGVQLVSKLYNADPWSPLHNVLMQPKGHNNVPAHYLQVAGMDPYRDNALVFAKELQECAVSTRIDVYPGQVHGFWLTAPELDVSVKSKEDMCTGISWLLCEKVVSET